MFRRLQLLKQAIKFTRRQKLSYLTRYVPRKTPNFLPISLVIIKENVQNFDLNLQEACELGEDAIVDLMNVLKERIVEVCKEYQKCLEKQTKIIQEASVLGSLSTRWDDLPEYRSLADEFNQELNSLIAVLNTVGQMVHEESLKYITDNAEHLKLIDGKFKEVQAVLNKELAKIRKSEAALLQIQRKSIVKTN